MDWQLAKAIRSAARKPARFTPGASRRRRSDSPDKPRREGPSASPGERPRGGRSPGGELAPPGKGVYPGTFPWVGKDPCNDAANPGGRTDRVDEATALAVDPLPTPAATEPSNVGSSKRGPGQAPRPGGSNTDGVLPSRDDTDPTGLEAISSTTAPYGTPRRSTYRLLDEPN